MTIQFERWRSGPVYVIAEIGVNHGGDVGLALQMIDAAKAAGADAVKFQTFTASTLATRSTPKVEYQLRSTPAVQSHFDMLQGLELSHAGHGRLFEYCGSIGIDFLSTPYDPESAAFLDRLGVEAFKVASADLVDLRLHERLASIGKPVLISTGMATIDEIKLSTDVYRRSGNFSLVLMHCVSNYPCSDESLNLRALDTLRETFRLPIGYSDHSRGSVAAIAATALGARVIEKHFTLDRTLPGPDHRASIEPDEFAEFVVALRRTESMLGSPTKACQPEERGMALVSRKSIVLARAVEAGHTLQAEDLTLRRPGTGLPASSLSGLIGRRTRNGLATDHLLSLDDLV